MSINFLYVSNELNTFCIHRCSSGVVLAVESMSVTVNLYTCMCDVGPFRGNVPRRTLILLPCGLRVVHIQVLKCATYTLTCSVRPDISHAAVGGPSCGTDEDEQPCHLSCLWIVTLENQWYNPQAGNVAGAKFVPPEIILRLA